MRYILAGVLFYIVLILPSVCVAQEPVSSEPKGVDDDESEYSHPVQYSDKQRAATCAKYQNSYVSYYGSVFKVEKCKLRALESHEKILEINRKQQKITEVPGSVIAQLEKGKPITTESTDIKKARTCKQLEGKYVTFSYTDVYYVEKCKKRAFPDWTSFVEHRKHHKRNADFVLALTWYEFGKLKIGRTMSSAIDKEFRKNSFDNNEVDVIPLKEACAGLNGKDVSYVDEIFRIENCRKRPYDVQKFLIKNRGRNLNKMTELSSEQWLSIPEGKPMY